MSAEKTPQEYYVYMLRCEDNSVYTGITTDVPRRVREHFYKDKKCAKYTLTHQVKSVEMVWRTESRASASRLEFYLKRLDKSAKEKLIRHPEKLTGEYDYQDEAEIEPIPDITIEECLTEK